MSGARFMVDELQVWGVGKGGQAARVFRAGTKSCHLTTDGPLEKLHAFAEQIGLDRAWFQPLSSPHYDLTAPRRAVALKAGAVFVPAREQAVARIAKREADRAATAAESHDPAMAERVRPLAVEKGRGSNGQPH